MMGLTVGVIGAGFVGKAVANGLGRVARVKVHDTDPERCQHTFRDVAEQDVIFVCVPTPTCMSTGACDLSILDSVLERLYAIQSSGIPVGTVVIKSTVPPGVVLRYCQQYPLLHFISNPEFLSERTAQDDFLNPARVVIGHSNDQQRAEAVADLYMELTGVQVQVLIVSHDEAALIKYASNCFYAAKITFFNEINQMCSKVGADYETIRQGVLTSQWVNGQHTRVPGPDGDYGFGGKCFPKDVMALAKFARERGVDPVMLTATLKKNDQVRSDRNWEHIEGALS